MWHFPLSLVCYHLLRICGSGFAANAQDVTNTEINMGSILVDGYKYSELTTIFHSHSNQEWVHNEFKYFHEVVKETGELPHTLLVDYCVESYRLHPHRFEKYHPWLSKEIEREFFCDHTTCYTPPPNSTQFGTTPEPNSLLLGSISLILFILWRRFR